MSKIDRVAKTSVGKFIIRFISKIQTDGKQFDSGLDVRQGGSDKVKHGQTR